MVADGIPYHMIGGMRFYARQEIKDILAYLRVLINPADEVSLKRIVNTPARGIGHATMEKITELARRKGILFYEALSEAAEGGLLAAGPRGKIAGFVGLLEQFRQLMDAVPLTELTSRIIQETGYAMKLKEERTDESQDRLANLEELLSALEEFERRTEERTLAAFLEQVALISDLEQEGKGRESATLMTLHSAKGLEFPLVFMVGMEEKLFPHARSLEEPEQMEEERRLCYVGMTRARERLFLTNARRRRIFGQEQYNSPSRFLADIPKELLDVEDEGYQQPAFGFGSGLGAVPPREPAVEKGPVHNLASVFEMELEPELANEVQVVPDETVDGVWLGMKVRHGKFGVGTVRRIEGSGNEQKVIVWFNSVGPKKLLVKFAGLERA